MTTLPKSDSEWKTLLTPDQFRVTRKKGTERAFSGTYNKHDITGMYVCSCCDMPLFDSKDKFDSGTGWPSYTRPVSNNAVADVSDNTFWMRRTEVVCKNCQAHLGHVFPDGPAPTGLRYCINSVSLSFKPKN